MKIVIKYVKNVVLNVNLVKHYRLTVLNVLIIPEVQFHSVIVYQGILKIAL